MALIEVLRVRRALSWYLAVLAVITLVVIVFGPRTHIGIAVPIAALVPVAMFFAAVFGSSVGTAFNRESPTRDISWTKPLPRPLFALQIVLVDLLAVALVYVLALAALVVILSRLQFVAVADPTLGAVLATGLGVSFMWYALINLLTCWFAPSARVIAGIIWPAALLLLALTHLDGLLGAVVRAIDVINPFAYMSGVSDKAGVVVQIAATPVPLDLRPAVVYAIAALFCALAIVIWPRKEA